MTKRMCTYIFDDAGTLGRVLNGSVVWPTAAARRVLGFSETPEVAAVDGGLPLALGAGFVARRRNATDLAPLPLPGIVVDHDGFLLPSTAANVPAIDSLGQETS